MTKVCVVNRAAACWQYAASAASTSLRWLDAMAAAVRLSLSLSLSVYLSQNANVVGWCIAR